MKLIASRRTAVLFAGGTVALTLLVPSTGRAKGPKYYFQLGDADVTPGADPAVAAAAREMLEKDLAARPEFTADPAPPGGSPKAFRVSLRLERFKKELKPPRAGGRLKLLALDVKLTVFGTTLPGAKLAFSGDGEASMEGEVIERRLDEETATLTKELLGQAVKQAMDVAVMKLGAPAPAVAATKRNKKKTAKRAPKKP